MSAQALSMLDALTLGRPVPDDGGVVACQPWRARWRLLLLWRLLPGWRRLRWRRLRWRRLLGWGRRQWRLLLLLRRRRWLLSMCVAA